MTRDVAAENPNVGSFEGDRAWFGIQVPLLTRQASTELRQQLNEESMREPIVRGTPADGGAEILLRTPKDRPRCLVHRGFFRRFADADSRDAVEV